MTKQWYIVHTYSGFEDRVQKTLEQRIEALGMVEFFGEIQVPGRLVEGPLDHFSFFPRKAVESD